jgi:hypothetical protein
LQFEITKPRAGIEEEKVQFTSTGTAVSFGTAKVAATIGSAPTSEQYALQILLKKPLQERR